MSFMKCQGKIISGEYQHVELRTSIVLKAYYCAFACRFYETFA